VNIRDVLPGRATILTIIVSCPIFMYQLVVSAWTYNKPFPTQRDWTDDI
jgi:hypothetical protein